MIDSIYILFKLFTISVIFYCYAIDRHDYKTKIIIYIDYT